MPTEHHWYIDKRVARVRFVGVLTIKEIIEALESSVQYVDTGNWPKVHFIHDWSELKKFPTNIMQIRREATMSLSEPEKLGWMVAYGNQDRLIRYVSQTVLQVLRIRFRMFPAEADALAYLQRMDATLLQYSPASVQK